MRKYECVKLIYFYNIYINIIFKKIDMINLKCTNINIIN